MGIWERYIQICSKTAGKVIKIQTMSEQKFFLTTLVCMYCLCSVSCTRSDWQEIYGDGNEVHLFAQIGTPVTKMTGNVWEGGEKIGVSSADEMYVYSIVDASGRMEAVDGYFRWRGEKYNLTAWYPYTENAIDLTDQSTAEQHYLCDLLYSEATVTGGGSTGTTSLNFSHQMTGVWCMLQTYTGYTDAEADQAKVYFYGHGSVSNSGGDLAAVGQPDAEITPYRLDNRTVQAMAVPCEMWDKPLIKLEIGGDTYVYTPTRESDTGNRNTGVLKPNTRQQYYLQIERKQLTVTMESVAWGDSETVGEEEVEDSKFKVNIPSEVSGLESYEVTGVEKGGFITDASKGFSITYKEPEQSGGIFHEGSCDRSRTADTEAGTVTFSFTDVRSDISLSHTLEYMEVGYYFYNDGTYGPDYDVEKTVGVIFGIGKHSTDDVSLYYGNISEIHGYVVALSDEDPEDGSEGFQWRSENADMTKEPGDPEYGVGDGKTTAYIGYAGTQYLIEKADAAGDVNAVPAASASVAKNDGAPITGTSGWYLPSRTQLLDIAVLGSKTLNGYSAMDGMYWTSSFDNNGTNAYVVVFGDGAIANETFYIGSDTQQKVRTILTF